MPTLLARASALAAIVLAAAHAPVAAQSLKVPAPEVGSGPPLAVPAVPSFELPPAEAGVRSVRELRVRGQRDWLGTEITVKGYITWIYDCVKNNARPRETPAQTQKRIDADQTLCERPKFYLGDSKDTSPERSIWVVDVPRPPTKLERERLPKDELAKWPSTPRLALGDHVAITGRWELQSPHGDHNSDGLLLFKSLQQARPVQAVPARVAPPAPPRPAAPPPKVPPAPPEAPIDPAKRQQSIREQNAGARALGSGDADAAVREYRASVTTWPANHVAWYYLAYAYSRKQAWAEAAAAAASSTRLAPDVAMYHLMYGICLYEAARHRASVAQSAAQGRNPEEIVPDMRAVNHDAALAQLVLATHLNDGIWRAHYYRGRVHRDRGDDGMAAELFTKAVRSAPPLAAPYVALAELYRRWDYFDQAIEIARLGAASIAAPLERGDVLYILGRAHEDKREDAAAVEAYTQALEARPELHVALFQRGQVLWRMKKNAAAKADLEAFLALRGVGGFAKARAQQLLFDLAAKKP